MFELLHCVQIRKRVMISLWNYMFLITKCKKIWQDVSIQRDLKSQYYTEGALKLIEDSPGCPSPTDSDVNMKEPSSSRSLIFFLQGRILSETQYSWEEKVLQFPPTSSPDRSEGCFIFLLVLFKREMKRGRPTALQPIQCSLQNSRSVSTWPNIYG